MTQAAAKLGRLLPRLNLATMLALVAAAGGSTGWYAYNARVQRQAVQALRDAGAIVLYDWEWDPGSAAVQSNGEELAGWRRTLADRFGPDAAATVAAVSLSGVEGEGGSGATDEHIKLVGRLKSLRSLELGAFNVTEAGAAPIAGLKHLRAFAIHDPSEGSALGPILARFGGDSRLEHLALINTAHDEEDIAAISRLSRLETLKIVEGPRKIGDADLAKLAALRRLKGLELWPTRITAEGLKSLGGMKSLESASFATSSIDDATPFLRFPKLRRLDLGHCRIGDEGIAPIAEMPALEHLNLDSNSLADAGLARLRDAPALRSLMLQSHSITDAGLESLAAIGTLKSIRIYGSRITPGGANEFIKAHPGISLQFLRLPGGSLVPSAEEASIR